MIGRAALSPLFADLYELTMAAGYWAHAKEGEATFSLFLRQQPQRGYFVSAGPAPALAMLEGFQFQDDEIDYLEGLGLFKPGFLNYLKTLRFSGDVWAMPEGSLVPETYKRLHEPPVYPVEVSRRLMERQ